MDLALLEQALDERGEPAFRTRQVWEWTARGASGYAEMTNLPRSLREELGSDVPFSTLTVEAERESRDGTVKTLFHTADGHPVEAVLMRYRDGRRSLCLSSQSGCPLTCTFCATGTMAFGRNLTSSEILDQALHFRRLTEVDHAVFMGMGEPMLNLDEVLGAARRLPDLGITHRRTTISTVGWLPGLRRFVDEVDEPIRLALSLHAPDDELRSRIMPVNDRYPIADVLAECRRHAEAKRRRVFVEYVMLAGVNDSPDQARALAELLGRDHFKVNLIPYNPWAASAGGKAADARPNTPPTAAGAASAGGKAADARPNTPPAAAGAANAGGKAADTRPNTPPTAAGAANAGGKAADTRPNTPPTAAGGLYDGSSRERIAAFRHQLERARVPVTVRLTRGRDIEAACGQLATAPRPRSAPAQARIRT